MPRGPRTIEVQWPAGGVNKRFAYQKQPPFTCRLAHNVCTEDPLATRLRGGTRPGLLKAIPTQVGGGNPISMLSTVHTVQARPSPSTFTEPFDADPLDHAWKDFAGALNRQVTISGGYGYTTHDAFIAGHYLDLTDGTDFAQGVETSKTLYMTVAIPATSRPLTDWTCYYCFFFKMDDTTPDIGNALVVVLSLEKSATGVYYVRIVSGTGISAITSQSNHTFKYWTDIDDYRLIADYLFGTSLPADFTATVGLEPSGLVRVGFNGAGYANFDCQSHFPDFTGNTPGFGIMRNEQSPYIATFTFDYVNKGEIPGTPPIRIVAGSNSQIWREIRSGSTQVMDRAGDGEGGDASNPNDLDLTTEHVSIIERFGTLYMADFGVKYEGSSKDVDGAVLTDGDVDFTTSVDLNGDYCQITNSTDTATLPNATYAISARTATTLTLAGVGDVDTPNAADAAAGDYRVVRGLKTYTSGTDLVALHAPTIGSLPVNCKIIALYRDRLCLAGDDDNPSHFYMSRNGNLTDWFASGLVTDGGRPVAGVIDGVDVGSVINRPLTALIPHIDDYLIFAAADAMWILRGDFAMQGFIDVLSRKIGVIDRRAWTTTPEGVLYFLSKEGLYKILPGSQQYPVPVSKDKLPRELLDVDPDLIDVTLQYDLRRTMIHIYLTSQVSGAAVSHYWVDVHSDAFWPMGMRPSHEPVASCLHESLVGETNTVLVGGRDGYIRRYSGRMSTDDGAMIGSLLALGPFGRPGVETMLHRLQATLGYGSGAVYWRVTYGDEAERVSVDIGAPPREWSEGANTWDHVRTAAAAFYINITAVSPWALESLIMELEPVAEWRPL